MYRISVLLFVLALIAGTANAQNEQASSSASRAASQSKGSASSEVPPGPKFVNTWTNVQVELTLTDQQGTQGPEKKTVSMIVASGSWGKVRSAGAVHPVGDAPYGVELNVDARPFVSTEGQIRLEMTLVYSPSPGDARDTKSRPTGINQSLTVALQSGKPLAVSQAADPVSDRKVMVEVKATILK